MIHLCPVCFENKYLRQRVVDLRRNRQTPNCSYHPTRKGLPISEVAGIIDAALRANYEFAFQSPLSPPSDSLLDLLRQLTEPVNDRIIDDLSLALVDADVVDEALVGALRPVRMARFDISAGLHQMIVRCLR